MKTPLRSQKAGAVTARSGSLQRMVSRCGCRAKDSTKIKKQHRPRSPQVVIAAVLKKLKSGHARILNVLRRPGGLDAIELFAARARSLAAEVDRLGQRPPPRLSSVPKKPSCAKRIQSGQGGPKRALSSSREGRPTALPIPPSLAVRESRLCSYQERLATANDLKLSERGGWRSPCAGAGGRGRRRWEAWAVTAGTVRCSAWLGVTWLRRGRCERVRKGIVFA